MVDEHKWRVMFKRTGGSLTALLAFCIERRQVLYPSYRRLRDENGGGPSPVGESSAPFFFCSLA